MVTLEALEADPHAVPLLPPDAALRHLPQARLESEAARRLRLGQQVPLPEGMAEGLVRAYDAAGQFLGIAAVQSAPGLGQSLKPVRLFNDLAPEST
jgi:tRNA pseudouridine55 synthase